MGVLISVDAPEVRAALQAAAEPCVVTMGTFDGVHRGHLSLINAARHVALQQKLLLVAVTLEHRPDEVFSPDAALPNICSLDERVRRLRRAGVDRVVVLPFDRDVAALDYRVFAGMLANDLCMRTLVVGEDFAFGHGRLGTPQRLRELGCNVIARPLLHDPGAAVKISSSDIRAALAATAPQQARGVTRSG